MHWDSLYVLQMSKLRTFQELATKARDMGVTIASRRGNSFYSIESKRNKVEFNKNVKFSKKQCPPLQVSQFKLRENPN